ncbi:gamma carbonic anhydrase family protein [Desulfobulbus rhabdoformis]|jgi:carbonic anhydrase/acetyltransferase-like protein (isoleucine patch superfamily)|uniref:gamma carbonic anhydrase family protein n=1 Tax=Desulfobulbus rhabdoformis TaxID=34032 RepID=UPI0019630504|nr:gamma carbonic anhydrase family protein [Desulfobulbus rhabdoformis]MBM9615060.1 gamma carbonic anhydrase family protein [Desulfobulbus rhabdoformis]
MILPYRDYQPQVGKGGWVAPNATLIGDVELGEDVSLWFGVIVRGDVHRIRIGARTNIQDLCLLHITQHEGAQRNDSDGHPTIIGSECTVGHRVILHGCTVGDCCLIGMGAILLDGVEIGRESIVGAGSVVTPGKKFPPRSLIMGTPAKVVREISDEQVQDFHASWKRYVALKNEYHKAQLGDCF